MYDRMQTLTKEELSRIHEASMAILKSTGVVFHDPEALEIFKHHGVKVDGNKVFPEEKHVAHGLSTSPSRFTLTARNPEHSVDVGEEAYVFVPGYGAPFLITPDGERRTGTLEDYNNFCKLVQTSKHLDMNGFLMIQPSDLPSETSHLDMLFSNMVLCEKAFMGSPTSRQAAIDSLEMAGIVWGGKEQIKNKPVMAATISGLAPLQYSSEMTAALIEFSRYGQPCAVRGSGTRGVNMPITLAGNLVVQNAMIMASLTLAQLVNPGTPIMYGGASAPMNIKTASPAQGAPEFSISTSAVAQIAKFYGLPSRESGALTDAHFPDAQAGIESALILYTCVRNGVHFILHACGILSSFLTMSYEKFIIDEELCGMVRMLMRHEEVTDAAIGLDEIEHVGIGGMYLTQPRTLKRFRTEFFLPDLLNRKDYDNWRISGKRRIDESAPPLLEKRLSSYRKPVMGHQIENDLVRYVAKRKGLEK